MTDTEMILQAIERLEMKVDSVKADTISTVQILLENTIEPKLQILAEGHETILEKLPLQEELDNINDRIAALEIAVRTNAREIAKLKRAN